MPLEQTDDPPYQAPSPPGEGSLPAPRDLALERIRHAVWQMRTSADLPTLLDALHVQIRLVGIRYQALGVNVVDQDTEQTSQRYVVRSPSGSNQIWETLVVPDAPISGGPVPMAWKAQRFLYRPDLHIEDPYRERSWADHHPIRPVRCVLDVPFSHGTLALSSHEANAFAAADIQTLTAIAGILSEGFRRLDDLDALERRTAEAEALTQAIAAVAGEGNIDQALQTIVEQAQKVVGAERVALFLYDEAEGALVPRSQVGHEWEVYRRVRLQPGEGASGQVLVSGKTLTYDHRLHTGAHTMRPETWSLLSASTQRVGCAGVVVPLTIAGRVVGTLSVCTGQRLCTPRHGVLLEQLASQAVLAIERVQRLWALEQEIAERRQVEQALRASEERFRTMFLEAPLGIALTDSLTGHFHEVNPRFAAIAGRTIEEMIQIDWMQITHPEDVQADLDNMALLNAGRTNGFQMEKRYLRPSGDVAWINMTIAPLKGERQGHPCHLAMIEDITKRKHTEQELVRIQRLRAAGELSAGVCHNLNNLLTGMLTPAELLQITSRDPKVQGLAGMVVEAGTRAAELVHRLHRSVRGEAAQAPGPVSLNLAIGQVVQLLHPKWKDEPEARGLQIDVCTALSEVPAIKATASELQDLLTNLLINAVDAMPEGGQITIRTAREGAVVRMDFADTGIGMDEATSLRIFEPFFTTKAAIGTGLGLSTLYNSLAHWGGTVAVESAPGKGTIFTLNFPVWTEEANAPAEFRPVAGSRPGKILIVEDDQAVCTILTEVLRTRHQVTVFSNGQQALGRFRAGEYDVAIIDLGMPGISGDRMAQRIQELDPAVARILCSGWELDAGDPRRQVFDFLLRKPLQDLETFDGVVAQAIVLRDRRRGGQG